MAERRVDPVRADEQVSDRTIVLWDRASVAGPPCDTLFEPAAWRADGRVLSEAEGRGAAYFLRTHDGATWVLRHYRRGGVLANINDDRYLWTGAHASRAAREFRLLATLYNRGLAVPRPVAARAVRRAGPAYTADLITCAVPGTRPLADRLADMPLAETAWHALGGVIAELHATGVWHADLNARNVLVDPAAHFHLIDFDRARFRGDGRWRGANLKRFRRSLDKFATKWPQFHFAEADWEALIAGYGARFSALGRL